MTTKKMMTTGSDRECRRCEETSGENRNYHPFSVQCRAAAYLVSLASDTEVATPTGWTTLEEITPGDAVFDEQGRVCKVAAVSGVSLEPVAEVKSGDGSSILAGKYHPWAILSPTDFSPAGLSTCRPGPWNGGCWPMATHEPEDCLNRTAERQRDEPRHYIPVSGALRLTGRELPLHPWIPGLWPGDGDSDSAIICCAPDDGPHYGEKIWETGEPWCVLNPEGTVLR